jgi:hypothetical protein
MLSFLLAITGLTVIGAPVAKAAVSPLITSYKPQVVNANVNASYTDGNGNTITATIRHPGIAMTQADLDNMRDHARAGDEPWNTAFNALANDSMASKTPRIYYENHYIFIHIQGPWGFTDPDNGVYYSNPSDYVGTRANTDALTAYKQTIMWYITGDETYRSNISIYLNSVKTVKGCCMTAIRLFISTKGAKSISSTKSMDITIFSIARFAVRKALRLESS